jgi:murein DD-endopeptidase MepM/ murein hydrolase activator NlpD
VFGQRREPHTVIIARGNEIRHFTVRPWLAALAGSAVAAMVIGYVLATSYLVLRDDLIGAAVARQARMQQAYEDRISALRAQVDRITSRQLLDQQLMEEKVGVLLARQAELAARQGRMAPLMEKSSASTGKDATQPAVAMPLPDLRADLDVNASHATAFAAPSGAAASAFSALLRTDPADRPASEADRADRLFVAINRSLRTIEAEQMTKLRRLTEDAYETAEAITGALAQAGLATAAGYGLDAVGGPLVAVGAGAQFDDVVEELDEALARLDEVKRKARKLPIANPAPGKAVSSSFGIRRDPIIGRRAMHAGMDFRAQTGAPVRASGAGVVTFAGRNGGYGRMVEIDHGGGLTTRYAHLSRIAVSVGDRIEPGAIVGKVGSSGRSTGPHLHYEVRRGGKALNPLTFIKAGKQIASLL